MSIDRKKIFLRLSEKTKKNIHAFFIEEIVSSTNDLAYTYAKENPDKNAVFLAEMQTAGRGQFDRKWISPRGNLYCSLVLTFEKTIQEIGSLSIDIAKSLILALHAYGIQVPITIKYPNDLMINNEKLAGILIETFPFPPKKIVAIIGFGINVNMTDSEETIQQPWTSLQKITHTTHDQNKVIAQILNTLMDSFT